MPYHEQTTAQKWDQLKAHTFLIFNDPDDGVDYLSVGEVLEIEHRGSDEETFIAMPRRMRLSEDEGGSRFGGLVPNA